VMTPRSSCPGGETHSSPGRGKHPAHCQNQHFSLKCRFPSFATVYSTGRYTGYVDSTRFDDDPVQVYLRELGAVPPLTKDQELELAQHVLANDQQAESAGKTLVEANLAMVVSIAERYPRGNMHLLDLVQRGNDGLLYALKTFPDHSNQTFSAYAAACVDAAIAKAIADSRPLTQ